MYARLMQLVAAALFFGLAVFFVADIRSFNFEVRRLPITIGLPLLVLSTINLVGVVRAVSLDRRSTADHVDREVPTSRPRDSEPDEHELLAEHEAASSHESAADMTRRLTAAFEDEPDTSGDASDVAPWAWLGVFLTTLYVLGTVLGGGVFTVLFLRLKTRARLRVAVTTALGLMLMLYFFVGGVLGVRFFPGRFTLLPRF